MSTLIYGVTIETPEHDKLIALNGANNIVGDFLEWLKRKYVICIWGDGGDYDDDTLYPVYQSTERMIAEYYGIDLDAFEQEKDAMLMAVRQKLDER
jgi:hypothetical protein